MSESFENVFEGKAMRLKTAAERGTNAFRVGQMLIDQPE